MMFIAHNSDRYGYLMMDGKTLSPEAIARRCSCSPEQFLTLLAELDDASIPSRTKAGVIFSRRMVRDAEIRAANRMYQTTHRKGLKVKENSKTDVRPMSDVSSSLTSSLKLNTQIEPEMVMRGVLSELCLSGRDLSVALDEVCRGELKKGKDASGLRDELIASWRDYTTSKPHMTQFTKGPAKFFGDGDWRSRDGWPWKDGKKPVGRRYVNK